MRHSHRREDDITIIRENGITMNRITQMLVAGSLLSVAALVGPSGRAFAAADCVGTVTDAVCSSQQLPSYPPNPGGSTDPSTTTTTIGVPVGGAGSTPVGGSSTGSVTAGATPTASDPTSAKVAGISLNAPTTAVPAAAPAVAPTNEVAATSPISFTGAQSMQLAGIAAALTALGACFVVIGRRRQSKAPVS
jgi:hypothetical protein